MAVRDDRQPLMGEGAGRGRPPRDLLGYLPVIIVASGLLMYAYLSICYDVFYGSLGVDPNDVGLSYTGTLARSSGFAITVTVLLASFFIGAWMGWRRRRYLRGAPRFVPPPPRSFIAALGTFLVVSLIVFLPFSIPLNRAEDAATDVKAGKPVGPVRTPLEGLPVLAIHADPATVEPAGKPGDSPAAERLRGRRLLYLGQASGTVVFYDVAAQQVVYVPPGSVILHVANCRGKPPDPACRQR
jgi:hypothetical protein